MRYDLIDAFEIHPMSHDVLGLDIGGANLKAAHTTGSARKVPFELWKHPGKLTAALRNLLKGWPSYDCIAVTMTAELCDCFENRSIGVGAILGALASAARGSSIWIWQTHGQFVNISAAADDPLKAASANWLALAAFAGRFASHSPALLIDIGSTTTDIVPLLGGSPVPHGLMDAERLKSRELVYTGVRRTPVCALAGRETASELFATTLDAYLILGEIEEDESDYFTADGRAVTKPAAHARLARMLGADRDTCKAEETLALAEKVKSRQILVLRGAVRSVCSRLPAPPRTIILAGSGEFLAEQVVAVQTRSGVETISLTEKLNPAVSQAACAYAVAILASEQLADE
jgi:probable H4MPT-linked C1 transfer pathway protein